MWIARHFIKLTCCVILCIFYFWKGFLRLKYNVNLENTRLHICSFISFNLTASLNQISSSFLQLTLHYIYTVNAICNYFLLLQVSWDINMMSTSKEHDCTFVRLMLNSSFINLSIITIYNETARTLILMKNLQCRL